MDINDVIDWLGRRDDIVIAQPEKFYGELKERFQESYTKGCFLEEVRAKNNEIREKYIGEGKGYHLLVLATDEKRVVTQWGGSVRGISDAYIQAALDDEDYVQVMENVMKAIIFKNLGFLGHDTD